MYTIPHRTGGIEEQSPVDCKYFIILIYFKLLILISVICVCCVSIADPVAITYNSAHPYGSSYAYTQQVDMPVGAVSMVVYFGSTTETAATDFVTLCKDNTCAENWGSFSGITFPGMYPSSALSIAATSLYISFSSGGGVGLGFDITVVPIYGILFFVYFIVFTFY